MIEPMRYSTRTLEWIRKLSVDIGPRPSGSQAEKQAQEVIESVLTQRGAASHWQGFKFPVVPKFFPYLTIPALSLICFPFLPGGSKAILAGLPFVVAGLPDLYTFLSCRLPHERNSQNLIMIPAGRQMQQVNVWLCAHMDSAEIHAPLPAFIQFFLKNYMDRLENLAWLVALGALSALAAPWIFELIRLPFQWFCVLLGLGLVLLDLWQQLAGRGQVTPGANDNASGAALAAVLFEDVMRGPPTGIVPGLLITGAEEAGLYGAQALVDSPYAPQTEAVIINLDMVGTGARIGYVSRAGRLKPMVPDSDLNTFIQTFVPSALAVDYRYRAGDFLPFLRKGYRTISLEATDRGEVPYSYHSLIDTVEHIQPQIVDEIGDLVTRLLSRSILTIRDK